MSYYYYYTPNNDKRLEREIQNWAQLYSYTIQRCIVQADSAEYIGWLAYTSYYTNVEKLREVLKEKGKFEWGFKMYQLRSNENQIPWNKRLKALGIYVPAKEVEVATRIVSEVFRTDK